MSLQKTCAHRKAKALVCFFLVMIPAISMADSNNGQQLWNSVVNERSCTSCHGDTPADIGKHIKTGKTIEPMALSVNAERYQDHKKVEKWFLRNCKWTFGRACRSCTGPTRLAFILRRPSKVAAIR